MNFKEAHKLGYKIGHLKNSVNATILLIAKHPEFTDSVIVEITELNKNTIKALRAEFELPIEIDEPI